MTWVGGLPGMPPMGAICIHQHQQVIETQRGVPLMWCPTCDLTWWDGDTQPMPHNDQVPE